MRVHRHSNAQEFLDLSQSWLIESEPENNLMLGIAHRSIEDTLGNATDEYWATVRDGSRIVGTSFRTPPYHLAISDMPSGAIPLLAADVRTVYPQLSGVVGPAVITESFARHWTTQYGTEWRTRFRQRIHVLRSVETIDASPAGALRQMNESDHELIQDWMSGFVRDTGIKIPLDGFVQQLLNDRMFFLWEDDEPLCLIGRGRDTPNGACITAVYTPPEFRCRGYATAAVEALSRNILSSGREFCCLYTDLDNPTSNSIYRKIGYQAVRDDLELEFEID